MFSKPFPITKLKYQDYTKSNILKQNFDYIILTSPKAIKVLDNLIQKNIIRILNISKIFAVGLETMQQLLASRYTNVLHANGNSKSLCQLVLKNTHQEDYGLWIAAKDRSVDLKNMLRKRNRQIEVLESYSTLPILTLPASIKEDLIKHDCLNLLIFSSRNVLIAKEILENYNIFKEISKKSIVFVNSKNVAQKAKSVGWIRIKTIKKKFTIDMLDHVLKLAR